MKTRDCVDTETGKELPPLPLSADLYAVHSSQTNQISIRKLRGWLPEWKSLKPVGRGALASGGESPVGSYAYVQLDGGRGRAPVMVLERGSCETVVGFVCRYGSTRVPTPIFPLPGARPPGQDERYTG